MNEVEAADVEVLRRAWAAGADTQDELAAVGALLQSLADDDLDVHRARNLLLRGRPADALAVLPQVSRDDVLAGRVRDWTDLVAAACWAAQGDERALGILLRHGAQMNGSAAQRHAYLVGAAAEQAGRTEVADQAWRLLFDTAPVTDHVFVRALTAQIARRDAQDASRAAEAVVGAAQALLEWHGADPDGIALVRDVVDQLVARGDRAGAALLTRALVRMRPGNERLAAAHRDHPVRRSPLLEHGAQVAGVLAGGGLVAIAVATDVPAIVGLTGVLVTMAAPVHRLRTARSMSPADDRVLREIDGVPIDAPASLPALARAPWWLVLAMMLPLSALVGFLVAFVVAIPFVPAEVELGDDPVVDGAVWGGTVVLTIAVLALLLRLRRRNGVRLAERRRQEEHRTWTASVGECLCWTHEAFRAPLAGEYLTKHLRPVSEGSGAAVARSVEGGTAAECPVTGARWLVLGGTDGAVRYLLRAPAVMAPEPAAAREVGGYL
ncbi:hypothetical protein [Cellulomonas sp. ATA003]|uniref:hypothetical protein n=1 Tax=Cellulomonas sp. ATA003 TaxID=3073064 RepID=UPI0028737CDD|nr:hypothetical protein [Cellulomonas sp. ATA003]WNB85467.1 hypothetical protein REH70_18160 [Cellulomonas sp. ATA003]